MALKVMRADSVKDAVRLLAADDGARIVSGGTLVVRDATGGDGSIRSLVLSDGLGLDAIAVEGSRATLGAAVSMAQVAGHPALGFLKPVALSIGGPAVRNMATVGGNLLAPYPYGDFAVALLALDATLTLENAKGRETMDIRDFFADARAARGAVIVEAGFALPPEGAFRFAKVIRKRPHGASVLSIAATLPASGGKITGARIAYGAMSERPMRASAVERAIEGKALDAATIAAVVKVAAEGCAPLTDPQASAWYRLNVLPVHLKRLLEG